MPSTAMVFSNPNHEVAILGSIARLRPAIIFLSDGGDIARVRRTAQALSTYVEPGALHFINRSEHALYEALLRTDVAYFHFLAGEVRDILQDIKPEAIYCEAAEFYNPLHDLVLPIVCAAVGRCEDIPLYEIPLIHQEAPPGQAIRIQRAPDAAEAACIWTELTDEELSLKLKTIRQSEYRALFAQLGDALSTAGSANAGREQFLKARRTLPEPAPGQALRYDRRGAMLKATGAVRAAITYRDHYVPMFESLCGG